MSRKHFQALASELKRRKPQEKNTVAMSAWLEAVRGVADVCSWFNGQFDRQRFLSACGVE